MAIIPSCDKCGDELNEFGAILLSPPDNENMVKKAHLCKACYQELASDIYVDENSKVGDG